LFTRLFYIAAELPTAVVILNLSNNPCAKNTADYRWANYYIQSRVADAQIVCM